MRGGVSREHGGMVRLHPSVRPGSRMRAGPPPLPPLWSSEPDPARGPVDSAQPARAGGGREPEQPSCPASRWSHDRGPPGPRRRLAAETKAHRCPPVDGGSDPRVDVGSRRERWPSGSLSGWAPWWAGRHHRDRDQDPDTRFLRAVSRGPRSSLWSMTTTMTRRSGRVTCRRRVLQVVADAGRSDDEFAPLVQAALTGDTAAVGSAGRAPAEGRLAIDRRVRPVER